MAWCHSGTKPLPKLMMTYHQVNIEQQSIEILTFVVFIEKICYYSYHLQGHHHLGKVR